MWEPGLLANAVDQLKVYQLTLRLREQARSHILPCPLWMPAVVGLMARSHALRGNAALDALRPTFGTHLKPCAR
jgi:hypothetical protein